MRACAGSGAGAGRLSRYQEGVDSDDQAGQSGDLWAQDEPECRLKRSRGNRDRDDVVADCLPKVLSHLSHRATADTDGDGYIERIGAHEHQVGSLDGDIGAGTNRHTEIGLSQGRCVVDSVTDHGDLSTVSL